MEKLKGLAIELDMDHLAVDRGLKGLKDNLRTVNSEMKRNMSAFDFGEKSVKKYETSLSGLNKKLEVQKVAVAEAKKEYEAMVKEHGHGSKEAERAAREYNNQAAALNNLERYIENTKKELAEFEKQQRIANSGWTKFGNKLEDYGGKLKGIGNQMSDVGSQMTNKITKPALIAGGAVGGMVAAFGWKRLTSLDAAQAQLKGLGYSTKEVGRISEQVTRAIDGGMTTMAEGTAVAAGALAAGVKEGKELERYIKLVGDAAVGANRPVEEMAQIFNRVQGAGKMMTQELNQIEHGMPGFSQAMAKHLGVPPEEMRKMVTAGKVTSKDFLNVMEDFAGGMASAYAESWDGMVANTKAYIGIIGENFLRGVFQDSKKSLADFIEMLKSPEVQQRAEEMGEKAQVAFNKMKDSIMGVVEWYINLDDGQKKVVHSLGLVAFAGGPVLQFTGKLTTGLGHVFEAVSKVSKAIGIARGAGLVAGLASLGPAGVAGVAVAGLGAVVAGLYGLHKANDDTLEGILNHTQKRREEIESLDETIDAYQKLQGQNKLTSDETLRYMDIMTELKNAKTEDGIKALTKEQEALLKKSGMTNDEMDEFLRLNGEIVSKTPEATQKISEQGNAYAGTAEQAKKLNDTERERLIGETYFNITGELHSQTKAFEKQAELQDTLNRQEDYRTELIEGLNEKLEKVQTAKGKEKKQLEEQIELEQSWLSDQDKKIRKTQKSIEQNDKKLEQFNQLVGEYEALVLSEVNLTAETGKGNEAIMTRKKEISETLAKLLEKHKAGELNTKEYQKQVDEVMKENKKLDEAKESLNNMQGEIDKATGKYKNQGNQIDNNNKKTDAGIKKEQARTKEAGKDVTKNVKATDNGTVAKIDAKAIAKKMKTVAVRGEGIAKLNADASKPVTKTVNVVANMIGRMKGIARGYEKGTPPSGHPGGDFIAGEKGEELTILPSGLSFLTPKTATLFPDMPRGTHVIPHRETKQILRGIPGYAEGTPNFGNSEFARLLMANSRSNTSITLSGNNSKSNSDTYLNKLLQATLEQNKLLMQLLQSNKNIEDKPVLTEGDIKRSYDKMDGKESTKHDIFTGRPGGALA